MSRFSHSEKHRRALEAAAIQYHGWGRSRGGYKLDPERHWRASTREQQRAAIRLTQHIIAAYNQALGDMG